jgi:uroporphyrinogen III methyltransferase/synthase
MGVSKIMATAKKLLEHGRDPNTPVAAIYSGTTPKQQTVITTLDSLAADGVELSPPVIFVVGPVAKLHNELDWFGNKLARARGKKVLLTRAKGHEVESSELMDAFGFNVDLMPLIEIVPREFSIPPLDNYDAIVLTSMEGVKQIESKVDLDMFKGKVFAIGPKTKEYLENKWSLDVSMGEQFNSEGLGKHILKNLKVGSNILTLRSSAASDTLHNLLSNNYSLDEVQIYDINRLPADPDKVKATEAIFVVSASCAKSITELEPGLLEGKTIISIGPETSKHLEVNHITSNTHTIQGMIDTYLNYLWTGYA